MPCVVNQPNDEAANCVLVRDHPAMIKAFCAIAAVVPFEPTLVVGLTNVSMAFDTPSVVNPR